MKELIRFIRNMVRLVTVLFSRCKMYLAEINYMEVRHRTLSANMPLDPLIVSLELLNYIAIIFSKFSCFWHDNIH